MQTFLGLRYSTPSGIWLERAEANTITQSYKRFDVDLLGRRWVQEVTLLGDHFDGEEEYQKLLIHWERHGTVHPFDMEIVQPVKSTAPTGTVATAAAARPGATSVRVSGAVPVGRMITFAGLRQPYRIHSYASGTMTVMPEFTGEIPNGARINFSPVLRCKYTPGGYDYRVQYRDGVRVSGRIVRVQQDVGA